MELDDLHQVIKIFPLRDPFWAVELEDLELISSKKDINKDVFISIFNRYKLLNMILSHLYGKGGEFYPKIISDAMRISVHYPDSELSYQNDTVIDGNSKNFVKLKLIFRQMQVNRIKLGDNGFDYSPKLRTDNPLFDIADKIEKFGIYKWFKRFSNKLVFEEHSVDNLDDINNFMAFLSGILSNREMEHINDIFKDQVGNSLVEIEKFIGAVNNKEIKMRLNLNSCDYQDNLDFELALRKGFDLINQYYGGEALKVHVAIKYVVAENRYIRQFVISIPSTVKLFKES